MEQATDSATAAMAPTSSRPPGSWNRVAVSPRVPPALPDGIPSSTGTTIAATVNTATALPAAPTRLRVRSPPATQWKPVAAAHNCHTPKLTSPATDTPSNNSPLRPSPATNATAPSWSIAMYCRAPSRARTIRAAISPCSAP